MKETLIFKEEDFPIEMTKLLVDSEVSVSMADARRLLHQGAVVCNGIQLNGPATLKLADFQREINIRVGKHKEFKVIVAKKND